MCLNPITLKTGDIVPCSKCPSCICRRTSAWSFRLMQQELVSDCSQFITLTYATKNLPFSVQGRPTLDKTDVQKFIKRLRKSQGKSYGKISYYCAGEYGSRTHRPHYHLIIFNARIDLLQPAWNLGDIHYGDVNGASIGYTLKYISKYKQRGYKYRSPEFQLMSKRLGENYLTNAMKKWHQGDLKNKMYCNTADNKKIAMPRYYKDKIYSAEQREEIAWHFQQKIRKETEEFNSSPDFETLFRNKKAGISAAYDLMYYKSTKLEKI